MNDLKNLERKVAEYKSVIANTNDYRRIWQESLRGFIVFQLNNIIQATGLPAQVRTAAQMANLEAVVLSLGDVQSGLSQPIGNKAKHLIKHNGSLIYQQLFNGKVICLIQYPVIENIGEPKPPKTVGIYRPEELKEAFFIRHVETFIKEVTDWEDYDDDEPHQKIGFRLNFDK